MASSEKLKKLIEEVREESSVAVQFSEKLTKEYSEDLDNAIKELEVIMDSIGESSIEDIPDTQLEYYCVKIPALMYRAGVKLEEFGLMADISSSQKRQEYNEAMLKVSGTVQERKARVDRLTTHGKRLYMYLEDTFYSPDNALISGIKAILAEEYSRELSKKINNSYKRRIEAAKNGEKISIVNNSRSLGYDKVNGELVINEKEAEVVRMIFNMYASGEGLRAISNTLYDMGYRNRSGNEIDPSTISRMLSSEKYKGVYVINQRHYDFDTKKTVLNPKSEWVHIPGAVPAIVEPELWDRVQEIKGSKVQSIKNEKRGRNCGKSIFSGKIYCAKCGAKYWRSLENGYVKFKCSSYSKYGKIPGKGCDNKSFSENALYSILQSLSEQIVEVNTAEVRKSLLNWLESLRERLRASQGDDTIKEEIRKQTARKEKLTDAYMDGIISKEDYSKRYKELEKTLEDLKDKLLTLEVNEDLQSIEEVIQNIDKEMEEYLQTQSFNESRVEFLNQHLTKVTVNKDSFLLEFDLIGGAILTGKDFYLFVDNPRRDAKAEYKQRRGDTVFL